MATLTEYREVSGYPAGLLTVGYTLYHDRTAVGGRVTAGVAESPAGSGIYGVALAYDNTSVNRIVWDTGATPARVTDEGLTAPDNTFAAATPAPGPGGASYLSALGDLNRRLGTYAALADPPAAFAWALRELGLPAASGYAVTDAEVSAVPAASLNRFGELALWRGLKTILLNLDAEAVNQAGDPEVTDAVRAFLVRQADDVEADLIRRYGFGLSKTVWFNVRLSR